MEADEAGRLRAFREKFGRGYDAERMQEEDERETGEEGRDQDEGEDNLMDLIGKFRKNARKKRAAQKSRDGAKKSEQERDGDR